MKPYTKHERELAVQASKRLDRCITPSVIRPLRRSAITLRRLFECECNGCTREKGTYESWEAYDQSRIIQMEWVEKRQATILKRIKAQCEALNIPFYIQSDPRGCSLYLGTRDNCRYDTEGIAIY